MTIGKDIVCHHCGLPVSVKRRQTPESVFCCYGCEIAFELLGHGDEAESRLTLYKLGAGVLLGINVMMFSMPLYVESLGAFFRQGFGSESYFEVLKWLLMALSLPVYFLLGMPFIESSIRNFRNGWRTNADALIAIGVTAAMLVSIFDTIFISGPVYYETAVAILVIVTSGRYLEAKSRAKASKAVEELDQSMPSLVSLIQEDGTIREVQIASVAIGSSILSKPGELIPLDCKILSGNARISEAMLTGEPNPIERKIGDCLLAGSVNYDGLLRLSVMKTKEESYIEQLKNLLIESKLQRSQIQDTADRVAEIAVPIILAVAIGSLFYWSFAIDWRHGLFAFLSVVLIACPCAIGIATPAALWMAVTQASKHGILFRSLGVVERLASIQTVFFDKTGTLTKGTPHIQGVSLVVSSDTTLLPTEDILGFVACVAAMSSHPLSRSIASRYHSNINSVLSNVREIAGQGISAVVDGRVVRIGSEYFVTDTHSPVSNEMTTVFCSVDDQVLQFKYEDEIKLEAAEVFKTLASNGYNTIILSGDETPVAESLGKELQCNAIGKLLPEDKSRIVSGEVNAMFIGDGFNDAPAIGAAQVGIAMGSGSDLIRSEADVIIFDNDLRRIPQLLKLSHITMRIVKQNLFWAFAYNVIGVVFAALGFLNPIIAAIAMTLSSLVVAQNSMRLRTDKIFRQEVSNA